MNSSEIAQAMTRISGAYGHVTVTDEMALMWAEAFAQSDGQSVIRGLNDWINTERYPPTIAGIREKMRDAVQQQAREVAWTSRPDPLEPASIHPREGKEIAARAYEAHCHSEGREPNWTYFDSAIGRSGPAPERATVR